MGLNTDLLNNPEVREIAKYFTAEVLSGKYNSHQDCWQEFVNQHSRKPIFKTCKEDGEQEVFEGDDVYFARVMGENVMFLSHGSAFEGHLSRHTVDTLAFRNRENAINYLCENYRFTVKELSTMEQDFVQSEHPNWTHYFLNEAKKRLIL